MKSSPKAARAVHDSASQNDAAVAEYRRALLAGSIFPAWADLDEAEKQTWRETYDRTPDHFDAKACPGREVLDYGFPEPDRHSLWSDFTGKVVRWNPSWRRWESDLYSCTWDRIPKSRFPLIAWNTPRSQLEEAGPSI